MNFMFISFSVTQKKVNGYEDMMKKPDNLTNGDASELLMRRMD